MESPRSNCPRANGRSRVLRHYRPVLRRIRQRRRRSQWCDSNLLDAQAVLCFPLPHLDHLPTLTRHLSVPHRGQLQSSNAATLLVGALGGCEAWPLHPCRTTHKAVRRPLAAVSAFSCKASIISLRTSPSASPVSSSPNHTLYRLPFVALRDFWHSLLPKTVPLYRRGTTHVARGGALRRVHPANSTKPRIIVVHLSQLHLHNPEEAYHHAFSARQREHRRGSPLQSAQRLQHRTLLSTRLSVHEEGPLRQHISGRLHSTTNTSGSLVLVALRDTRPKLLTML